MVDTLRERGRIDPALLCANVGPIRAGAAVCQKRGVDVTHADGALSQFHGGVQIQKPASAHAQPEQPLDALGARRGSERPAALLG